MGKRKSKKKVMKKAAPRVGTVFDCIFCNHPKTVECRVQPTERVGSLRCRICDTKFQTTNVNHLSDPIDIYSEWIDETEKLNAAAAPAASAASASASASSAGRHRAASERASSGVTPARRSRSEDDSLDNVELSDEEPSKVDLDADASDDDRDKRAAPRQRKRAKKEEDDADADNERNEDDGEEEMERERKPKPKRAVKRERDEDDD
jgi:transcription elongation factor Elf1